MESSYCNVVEFLWSQNRVIFKTLENSNKMYCYLPNCIATRNFENATKNTILQITINLISHINKFEQFSMLWCDISLHAHSLCPIIIKAPENKSHFNLFIFMINGIYLSIAHHTGWCRFTALLSSNIGVHSSSKKISSIKKLHKFNNNVVEMACPHQY